MLGAIIGDIAGSRFEFNNYRKKDFELFAASSMVTDDSIMSLAVAKAIMETNRQIKLPPIGFPFDDRYAELLYKLAIRYMKEIGRRYPHCGYGGMFARWLFSDHPEPYGSYGNGAAMRISPAGFAARTQDEAISLSRTITSVTHNHKEGIKGAEATALAIFMARHGFLKSEIRERIKDDYYPLDFTIDGIRPKYKFNETCQGTVPQAIECFLESTSFEDTIRTAVSLGGDSDTLAAIAGGIAEAYYGIQEPIRAKTLTYLGSDLLNIYVEWEAFIGKDLSQFTVLTKYIDKIEEVYSSLDRNVLENEGNADHPYQELNTGSVNLIREFEEEFNQFSNTHSEYHLSSYMEILEKYGLKWDQTELANADIAHLDAQGVLALIKCAISSEPQSSDALPRFFSNGSLLKRLKQLQDLDKD